MKKTSCVFDCYLAIANSKALTQVNLFANNNNSLQCNKNIINSFFYISLFKLTQSAKGW